MRIFSRKKRLTKREFLRTIIEWTVYGFSRDLTQYFHLDLYPDMKRLFDGMSKERRDGAVGELIVLHIFGMLEHLGLAGAPFEAQDEYRKTAMGMAARELIMGVEPVKLMEYRFAQYRKIWAENGHSDRLGAAVAENIFGSEELSKAPAAKLLAGRAVMNAFKEYMNETGKMLEKYDLLRFRED